MSKVILMCGIPGSGKSTLAKGVKGPNSAYISRDEIRFAMVKETEPYFSKEDQVFECFISTIKSRIMQGINEIFVDATHLNRNSRAKVMGRLKGFEDIEFEAIFVATPLEIALERNEQRAGTRAYVPPEVIANMYQSLRAPAYSEGFKNIYIKEVDKVLYLKEKPNNE